MIPKNMIAAVGKPRVVFSVAQKAANAPRSDVVVLKVDTALRCGGPPTAAAELKRWASQF
jgi:hypothetical protein